MKAKLYAVVRPFNSVRVLDLIHRLSLSWTPLTSIIVVIDAKRDSINTPKVLREITCRFPIRIISLEQYGWSKALNAAIESLPAADAEVPAFVMPISNEVMIEPDEIGMLLEAALHEGASCGYAVFEGRCEPSYRVPRNTCAVWNRNLFLTIGLFDEDLDDGIGMEDYEMVLRAFDRMRLLPFAIGRRVKLLLRDPASFQQKIAAEEQAINAIGERYSQEVVRKVQAHLEGFRQKCS